MRVLAIDPSLRGTGYAILEAVDRKKISPVDFGVIRIPQSKLQSQCLAIIHETIAGIIARYSPQEVAVEGVIFVQSYRTAITLGAARGAAVLAAAERGLPIHEYAPKRVKQAVVGRGAAQKHQVAFMIRAMLCLTETPPPDAADALAIGITHLQSIGNPAAPPATRL